MYEWEDNNRVVSHSRPFAYTKRTDPRPILQPYAYKARDLLDCIVASFYKVKDKHLTPRQLRAKQEFNSLFERYAKKRPEELQESEMYNIIKKLGGLLDEFLFFRSTTCMIDKFIYTTFPPNTHRNATCEEVNFGSDTPKFKISLHKRRRDRLATLPELLDSLAHEMIHAFLIAYTCPCPKCLKDDYNCVGRSTTGHGPIFRGFHYAIMKCLAEWSPALDEVFKGRTNGTYIDIPSVHMERTSRKKWEEIDSIADIKPYPYLHNPNHSLHIYTHENIVIIDTERLRAHVRSIAAPPRCSTTSSMIVNAGSTSSSRSNGRSSSDRSSSNSWSSNHNFTPSTANMTQNGRGSSSLKERSSSGRSSSSTWSDHNFTPSTTTTTQHSKGSSSSKGKDRRQYKTH